MYKVKPVPPKVAPMVEAFQVPTVKVPTPVMLVYEPEDKELLSIKAQRGAVLAPWDFKT